MVNTSDITTVMVTYNPPAGLRERIAAVLGQVGRLVVVDNHSDMVSRTLLEETAAAFPGRMEILWNAENKGLAAALNQGIHRALERQAHWVLLLDHDSCPQSGMISRMLEAYAAYPQPDTIGLIAPEIIDEHAPHPTRYLISCGKYGFRRVTLGTPTEDRALTAITSGSLVRASVFQTIGFMPEAFFIDYIDHAFCLHLRRHGYRILLVKDARLNHRLGHKTQHSIAGVTVVTPHHPPQRRYYIFRNRLWVWKLHGAAFPGFVLHDALALSLDIARVLLLERDKWEKCKAMARGGCDGLWRITKAGNDSE